MSFEKISDKVSVAFAEGGEIRFVREKYGGKHRFFCATPRILECAMKNRDAIKSGEVNQDCFRWKMYTSFFQGEHYAVFKKEDILGRKVK